MSEDKQQLRRRLLAQRAAQDAAAKRETDRRITAQVFASGLYRQARSLFVYVSTPQEIDTHAIIRQALDEGRFAAFRTEHSGRLENVSEL